MQNSDLQQMIEKYEKRQRLLHRRAVFLGIFLLVMTAFSAFMFRRTLQKIGSFDFPSGVGPYNVYCHSVATAIVLSGYSVCALLAGIPGVFLVIIGIRKNTMDEFLIQLVKRMLMQDDEGGSVHPQEDKVC